MKEGKPEKGGVGRDGLRWMGAGVEFCGVISLFSYFGYKLDKRFDTSPLLLIVGFFISFIGMVYVYYKESR